MVNAPVRAMLSCRGDGAGVLTETLACGLRRPWLVIDAGGAGFGFDGHVDDVVPVFLRIATAMASAQSPGCAGQSFRVFLQQLNQ